MKDGIKLSLTPITEDRLIEVGFEKVIERDRDVTEYNYLIRLPKDSADPHCMCLVSSYSTEWKELKLREGEFIVELFDGGCWGDIEFEGIDDEDEEDRLRELIEEEGFYTAIEEMEGWSHSDTDMWIWGPIAIKDEEGEIVRIIEADDEGNVVYKTLKDYE